MYYINNVYSMDDEFAISLNDNENNELHKHEFIEFVYELKGKTLHNVNGREYLMNSGDLLMIDYGETHSIECLGTGSYYNILLKPSYINKAIEEQKNFSSLFETDAYKEFKTLINMECRFISFTSNERSFFESMLAMLSSEIQNRNIGSKVIIRSGANFLLTMILRRMNALLLEKRTGIMQVLKYIDENYGKNISASYLSELCHYNPGYFSRFFKKEIGMTLTEYIKRVRVQKACMLLEKHDTKIDEVCTEVGYTNKTRFYMHFREITKRTPREYRKFKLDTFSG